MPAGVQVLFLLSVPTHIKEMLLSTARLLVYTPSNEHFGIVPLEAMLAGVPLLAADSGGPLETVVEGKTGWLRDANKIGDWTEVMRAVLVEISHEERLRMGKAGTQRVKAEFSRTKMSQRLNDEIDEMIGKPRAKSTEIQELLLLVIAVSGIAVVASIAFFNWPQ